MHTSSNNSSSTNTNNSSTDSLTTANRTMDSEASTLGIRPISRVFSDPLHHYSQIAKVAPQSKAFTPIHHYTAATAADSSAPTASSMQVQEKDFSPIHYYPPTATAVHIQSKDFTPIHHYPQQEALFASEGSSAETQAESDMPMPPQTFQEMGIPLHNGPSGYDADAENEDEMVRSTTTTDVGSPSVSRASTGTVAGGRRKRDMLKRIFGSLF